MSYEDTDQIVLKLACERAIEKDSILVHVEEITEKANSESISEPDLRDSLEALDERRSVSLARAIGGFGSFTVTEYGFEEYAREHLNYDSLYASVAFEIVNNLDERTVDNKTIAATLDQPRVVIDFILKRMASEGNIEIAEMSSNYIHIHSASISFKRKYRK